MERDSSKECRVLQDNPLITKIARGLLGREYGSRGSLSLNAIHGTELGMHPPLIAGHFHWAELSD